MKADFSSLPFSPVELYLLLCLSPPTVVDAGAKHLPSRCTAVTGVPGHAVTRGWGGFCPRRSRGSKQKLNLITGKNKKFPLCLNFMACYSCHLGSLWFLVEPC